MIGIGRAALVVSPSLFVAALAFAAGRAERTAEPPELFRTADACMSCHNRVTTETGEDISIGFSWRSSMMANAARDPYWHAAVRREVMDFPDDRESIENECSRCHMPMSNETARAEGRLGDVFAHLPIGESDHPLADLAADGVSCTVCHQIQDENLGTEDSFTGGFVIDRDHPWEQRPIFGPFEVDTGRVQLMRSASAFVPTEATHVQRSELCATCHTLYTHALGAGGGPPVELPEQMPYLEWLNSDFRDEMSCQTCHMPVVADSTAITSVLGQPRPEVSRHVFRGGNFFMLRMLNRYRDELGVEALPQELEATARRTEEHLRTNTAVVTVEEARVADGRVEAVVAVENLAGHKLPTAYPSRRAWLEVTVTDGAGRTIFSSGALRPDGSIVGNDNDVDAARFEPHHDVISDPESVQIYESIMAGPNGEVTTGLLTGVDYLKDNRILPRGFDKAGADPDVAVHGGATGDENFVASFDRVTYRVPVGGSPGPYRVEASLWYQPIGFRWAQNLRDYDAFETNRFVRYYEEMSEGSAIVLARGAAVTE